MSQPLGKNPPPQTDDEIERLSNNEPSHEQSMIGCDLAGLKEHNSHVSDVPLDAEIQARKKHINDIFGIEEPKLISCPVDALGETLANGVKIISEYVQVPLELAFQSVLASASLATQGQSIVKFDGREYRLSLLLMTIAESGDRKSSSDRLALAPIIEYQKQKLNIWQDDIKSYKTKLESFNEAQKNIKNTIKTETNQEIINKKLSDNEEPKKPLNEIVIISEATIQGIQKSYVDGTPAKGLFTDEGGSFFGGHSMKEENIQQTISLICQLWDGSDISKILSNVENSLYLPRRAFCMHLMLQPIIYNNIAKSSLLKEQGILARFLVKKIISIAGSRLYKGGDVTETRLNQ